MDDIWRVITGFPVSPLTAVLALWAVAVVCHARRRDGWAVGLAIAGAAMLWICSTPALAMKLESMLVERAPALPVEASPQADLILLLGGALASPGPPHHRFRITPSADRVWHAAALYRAGKAPSILVSGGPGPDPAAGHAAEAVAIADLLVARGVPRSAILLETRSKNTRENATFSLQLVLSSQARRILLVTSPSHMSRALETFRRAWPPEAPQLLAAGPPPLPPKDWQGPKAWLPTGSALLVVTKCLKEFAGMAVLAMI